MIRLQFKNDSGELEVAIGDDVEALTPSKMDETRLSREKQRASLEAKCPRQRIHHRYYQQSRRRFAVDIDDIRAFCPALWWTSDLFAIPLTQLPLEFGHQLDQRRNNVVVSTRGRKRKFSGARSATENLQEGATIDGVVAFYRLARLWIWAATLLRITDMA